MKRRFDAVNYESRAVVGARRALPITGSTVRADLQSVLGTAGNKHSGTGYKPAQASGFERRSTGYKPAQAKIDWEKILRILNSCNS
jgi:hypothetical protein